MDTAEILDEAYGRLHRTGPEWGGNLANHGPMAAEAPNAVLHTLPALPQLLWLPSLTAAWAASAAITAMYAPASAQPDSELPPPPPADDPVAEVIDRATAHGDEHVIKFTDTAAWVYQRTANPAAVSAALLSTRLLDPSN